MFQKSDLQLTKQKQKTRQITFCSKIERIVTDKFCAVSKGWITFPSRCLNPFPIDDEVKPIGRSVAAPVRQVLVSRQRDRNQTQQAHTDPLALPLTDSAKTSSSLKKSSTNCSFTYSSSLKCTHDWHEHSPCSTFRQKTNKRNSKVVPLAHLYSLRHRLTSLTAWFSLDRIHRSRGAAVHRACSTDSRKIKKNDKHKRSPTGAAVAAATS